MKTYKTKALARWANKQGIADEVLCETARQAVKKPDANLGGEERELTEMKCDEKSP